MEDILDTTTSPTKIKRLNACRLYLRITFYFEISNIQDTVIIIGSLTGDKTKLVNSNIEWPNQSKPYKSTWYRMLTRLYCTQSNSNILRPSKRLGKWSTKNLQSTQQHKYLYPLQRKNTFSKDFALWVMVRISKNAMKNTYYFWHVRPQLHNTPR